MGNDGANAYHGVLADGHAAKDSTAGSNAGSAFDQGGFEFPSCVLGVRVAIVGERDVGANADVIFQRDTIPYLDAVLDGHIISYHCFVLDEAVAADIAVLADLGFRQDNTKLPYVG